MLPEQRDHTRFLAVAALGSVEGSVPVVVFRVNVRTASEEQCCNVRFVSFDGDMEGAPAVIVHRVYVGAAIEE